MKHVSSDFNLSMVGSEHVQIQYAVSFKHVLPTQVSAICMYACMCMCMYACILHRFYVWMDKENRLPCSFLESN